MAIMVSVIFLYSGFMFSHYTLGWFLVKIKILQTKTAPGGAVFSVKNLKNSLWSKRLRRHVGTRQARNQVAIQPVVSRNTRGGRRVTGPNEVIA